jgi:hypothetical protein
LADRSGITVQIDSGGARTITDPTGHWAITGLHTGTYTISISKEGFGIYKLFGLQYVGGATTYAPGPIELGRVPTDYTVSSLEIDSAKNNPTWIALKAVSSPLPDWVAPTFLVGRAPSVSSDPATYQLPVWTTATANGVSTGGVAVSTLVSLGFKRGDRIFITACMGNSKFGNLYWNPIFNVTVDPTMSSVHSNVISVTLP